jgi:arsenate reductase
MTILYGIKNCDTVRKARRWLKEHDIEYRFHDVREDGISKTRLNTWIRALGWEQLLNRRGTTWRRLPATTRDNIDRASATSVMLEQPAIIKRPVLEHEQQLYLGFSEASYAEIFRAGAHP